MPMQVTERVPDVREVFTEELGVFSNLIERRNLVTAEIKVATEQKKKLDELITEALLQHDCRKLQYGEQVVQMIESERTILSPEKLLEAGVSASTIKKCMVTTRVGPYLRID
jgi:hypothetical protein